MRVESLERRDCPATVAVIGPGSLVEGDSGFTDAVFTVSLSAPVASAASIDYRVVGGTASSGTDFNVPSGAGGRITFAAGETTKSLTVRIVGDTVRESDESFSVRLASPRNCTLGTSVVATTITDDDSNTLSVVAPTSTFPEGTPVAVTIKLASPAKQRELVSYRTVDGSARGGLDFGPVAGKVVTFEPGQDTQTVTVSSFADGLTEGPEYFTVLVKPLDARLGPEMGVAVFLSDGTTPQPVPALVTVNAVTPAAAEAGSTAGVLRFTRTGGASGSLAVNYVVSGTATPASDYAMLSGVVTFAAGQSFVDVAVTPVDDTLVEPTETVTVTLATGTAYIPSSPASATVTITSDDVTNPNPTTPPTSQKGFQVDFVFPTNVTISTTTRRMFTEAANQWSAILGDVPDVFDSNGQLLVDDFQLVVKFVSAPTDPVNRPWQQPNFGGAWYTDRRGGTRGLPYHGEAEITVKALEADFFNKMKPSYDKFSMYKTMELIGRAIGFDYRLLTDPAFDLVHWYRYRTGTTPAVDANTTCASYFQGTVREVPLDVNSWPMVPQWTTAFGGSTSFGFDVFVAGWQTRSSVNGQIRPQISNVTRGLFADLGYTVRYL